ncbi:MAG: hypothetical protein FE047_00675 [Thermoplasmata archaeon]|nr:MAG: hypothetical protein FE047_00675 [Thermoplasmata archaeon]
MKKVLSVGIVILFILPAIEIKAESTKIVESPLFLCHITANGTGKFIWWLCGASYRGFGSILVSTINYQKEGQVKISSILNPNKQYTFTGKQHILLIGYTGRFVWEPKDDLFHISLDGIALVVIDIPIS